MWAGQIAAPDLLARITLALGLAPDHPGRPWQPVDTPPAEGGSSFIDCGRPLGHLQDLLHGLRRVAVFAQQRGRDVC